jgi:hypothetical protein
MITEERRVALENVCREIGRIANGGGTFQDISKGVDFRAFTPVSPDPRGGDRGRTKVGEGRGPFGRWLVRQPEEGVRAGLIRAAKADRKFPLDGDADAARARLNECSAEGDMFEALDDAELDWASV